jgi:hypothetical protein
MFLAGILIGSFNSSYVGRVIKAGDPKRANQFKKIEEEVPEEGFENLDAKQIIQNLTFRSEDIETVPTRDRYADFVQTIYRSVYGNAGEDLGIMDQMDKIQSDSQKLTIEDDSLLDIVSGVSSTENENEIRNSELYQNFFNKLTRYLDKSKDQGKDTVTDDDEEETVTDEELAKMLDEVGQTLNEHREMQDGVDDLIKTLQQKGYEANSIPTDPNWDRLHDELREGGCPELTQQIGKLVSILRLYERELSASRSLQSEQNRKIEILEQIREYVNIEWLRNAVESEGEDILVVAAREGVLGARVISYLAKELTEEPNAPNSKFLRTLAKESPSHEEDIEDSLIDTLDNLQEYETIRLQLEGTEHSELEDRMDQLETDIESMSSEVRSRVIEEHAEQLTEELERISETNRLDLYTISKQIEYLEWAVKNLDKSTDHGSVETLVSEIDSKRKDVEEVLSPGNYDVTTGHKISEEFVELADDFRAEATKALDKGDEVRAEVLLLNSNQLLETVENLYINRDLRKHLQNV